MRTICRIAITAALAAGLMFGTTAAFAAEKPDLSATKAVNCNVCGMGLASYNHSRMQITYVNGTRVDVCSLFCARREMNRHKDEQVQSLLVADYTTGAMIDARKATWVVGGSVDGGMNAPAKWAFARADAAQAFVLANGGHVTAYDTVMDAADKEADQPVNERHGHAACLDAPGGQLIFNPAFGDDIYHTHPAGCGMFNVKYMHTDMDGLRAGTSDVGLEHVGYHSGKPYDYMMIPTSMTMDMYMFMAMYGISDRLTVMAMGNYQENAMDMLMDMGMGMPRREPTMYTRGLGDTELRGVYEVAKSFFGSLGLSLPTGDIDQSMRMMGTEFRAPYDMQLGSGSVDLKPALTYSDLSDDALWNWGAQALYTWHTAENEHDYRLGDSIKVDSWLQRSFGPAAGWLRLAYSHTDSIHGRDPEIQKILGPSMMPAPAPDADPRNYGGERVDGAIGTSCKVGMFSVGVEGGIPLYQDLNGLQLKTDWFLTVGAQCMF